MCWCRNVIGKRDIPRVPILIEAEIKVEMNQLVVLAVSRCSIESLEVRVVKGPPLIYNIEPVKR